MRQEMRLRSHALLEAHRRGEAPTKCPSLSIGLPEDTPKSLPWVRCSLPLYPSPPLLLSLLLFPSPQLGISQLLSFPLNLLSGGPARAQVCGHQGAWTKCFLFTFSFPGRGSYPVDLRLELRQDKRDTRGQGLFQARNWLLVP